MNATQQYLLDSHRAARYGDRRPPQPGQNDWQVIRELTNPPPRPTTPRPTLLSRLHHLLHPHPKPRP
ncbi:hypothetical protein [Streptomyces sp. NPDC020141]|uniref:hypothetical protein n=1 Tax=Streptomyces sp. NPDC020141 TaxID=3365065 RepID=UPI0037A8942E